MEFLESVLLRQLVKSWRVSVTHWNYFWAAWQVQGPLALLPSVWALPFVGWFKMILLEFCPKLQGPCFDSFFCCSKYSHKTSNKAEEKGLLSLQLWVTVNCWEANRPELRQPGPAACLGQAGVFSPSLLSFRVHDPYLGNDKATHSGLVSPHQLTVKTVPRSVPRPHWPKQSLLKYSSQVVLSCGKLIVKTGQHGHIHTPRIYLIINHSWGVYVEFHRIATHSAAY